jgi:RHS repeat-associated protein
MTDFGNNVSTFAYDNVNRHIATMRQDGFRSHYQYDASGNMSSDGQLTYTWNHANRLTQMGTTTYAYDGMGNRVSQDNGTDVTNYLLDVQPSLAKVITQTTGANTERFVHAQRGIHAMEDNAGIWSYMLQDGLGSVRAEADTNAVVSASQSYAPFGQPMNTVGNFSPFAFTGEQRDGNGLQYHRARYMNPNIGGFLSLDPFEGVHNRPMSLNGYAWVEGNVPNMIDPSGEFAQILFAGAFLGAVFGGAWDLFVNQGFGVNGRNDFRFNGFCGADWEQILRASMFGGMVGSIPGIVAGWGSAGFGVAAFGNSVASGVATVLGTGVSNVIQGADFFENQSAWSIGSNMFFGAIFGGGFGAAGKFASTTNSTSVWAGGMAFGTLGVVATTTQTMISTIVNPYEVTPAGIASGSLSGVGYATAHLPAISGYSISLLIATFFGGLAS